MLGNINTIEIARHIKAQLNRNNMGNFNLFNYFKRQHFFGMNISNSCVDEWDSKAPFLTHG